MSNRSLLRSVQPDTRRKVPRLLQSSRTAPLVFYCDFGFGPGPIQGEDVTVTARTESGRINYLPVPWAKTAFAETRGLSCPTGFPSPVLTEAVHRPLFFEALAVTHAVRFRSECTYIS